MTTAVGHPSAGRAGPPIPFPLLIGVLILLLISAIGLRWPRSEPTHTALSRKGSSGPVAVPERAVALPRCAYADAPAAHRKYSDWRTTLLDPKHALPPAYSPPDLVPANRAGFEGFLVRAFVINDLAALRSAAEAAGTPVDLAAAYRSYAQQADLYRRREAAAGRERALRGTARPGHSEHQLGTAVDFKSRGASDVDASWGGSPTGRWMLANAHRFGFVLSYPAGRTDVTCYSYEPWHFRYFGRGLAGKIHASGLTVRQYLWAVEQRSSGN